MAETAKEFLDRLLIGWSNHGDVAEGDWPRLFTLARRGAAAGELLEALRPFVALANDVEKSASLYAADDPASDPENWMKGCAWEDLVNARAAIAQFEGEK